LTSDEHARQPTGLIGSAARALRVLEVVAAAGDPITAKAVARRTGYKLSTTYHLLNTLAHEGYLIRVGHGRGFRIGSKIGNLSADSPPDRRCLACGSLVD
jgi:DNA-binding IclR family transcriptional regulator